MPPELYVHGTIWLVTLCVWHGVSIGLRSLSIIYFYVLIRMYNIHIDVIKNNTDFIWIRVVILNLIHFKLFMSYTCFKFYQVSSIHSHIRFKRYRVYLSQFHTCQCSINFLSKLSYLGHMGQIESKFFDWFVSRISHMQVNFLKVDYKSVCFSMRLDLHKNKIHITNNPASTK